MNINWSNSIREKTMLTDLDKSNYLRGLLILSRLDHVISDFEKKALIVIGKILEFDPHFCSDAIEELADNQYISEKPPIFSNRRIGLAFINDSLKLAFSDHVFHLKELRWIKNVARLNSIDKSYWMERAKNCMITNKHNMLNYDFEIERLVYT